MDKKALLKYGLMALGVSLGWVGSLITDKVEAAEQKELVERLVNETLENRAKGS